MFCLIHKRGKEFQSVRVKGFPFQFQRRARLQYQQEQKKNKNFYPLIFSQRNEIQFIANMF